MNRSNKYLLWVEKALERVSDDFCKNGFRPGNESDVKVRLCTALENTKSGIEGLTPAHAVHTEFRVTPSLDRTDIAIIKYTMAGGEPRLLIEIKETSRCHLSIDEARDRIQGDIKKLRECGEFLENEGKKVPTLVIVFFFRGDDKNSVRPIHGIGVRTDAEMEQLKHEYGDVSLVWGPR